MKRLSAIVISMLLIFSSLIVLNPNVSAVPVRIYIHVDSVNGGNPVTGANVTLVNQVMGTKLNGHTDSNGDLFFDADLGSLFNPSQPDLSFSFADYNQSIKVTVEHEDYVINSKTFAFEPGQVGLVKGWVNITMEPPPTEGGISKVMLLAMIIGVTFAMVIGIYMYTHKDNKKKDKKR